MLVQYKQHDYTVSEVFQEAFCFVIACSPPLLSLKGNYFDVLKRSRFKCL